MSAMDVPAEGPGVAEAGARTARAVSAPRNARTLGTGGGAVCEDPDGALKNALRRVSIANGATGPGRRPVIADERVLKAGTIVLQVYCPDKLDTYRERIADLKTGHTAGS